MRAKSKKPGYNRGIPACCRVIYPTMGKGGSYLLSLHFLCRQLDAYRMRDTVLRGRDTCPHQIELLDTQEVTGSSPVVSTNRNPL